MGSKIEARCRIRKLLRVGYEIKMSWWDRAVLILIGGVRDSFEVDGGMQDLSSK